MESNVKSSIPALIRLAKEEQAYLKQWASQIATRQDVVKRVIELLEGPVFNNSLSPPSNIIESIKIRDPVFDNSQVDLNDQYSEYPRKASKQEKIKYILTKERVAMLSTQIKDLIRKMEGPTKSKETLKNFYYVINSMVASREVLSGRVANRRYTFYILPDFLDIIGKLKPEHIPKAESFGNLDEMKRNKIVDCFLN